ncbi:MAG: hypothetical protein ABEJ36_02795 [Candidatus Nanosalina sp.]
MTNGNPSDDLFGDDELDVDELVQVGSEGPNRFERILEQGDTGRGEYFADVDLDNAKYLITEAGGEVSARYHHNRGGEIPELDVEHPDYESVELGPGTAALMLEVAVSYPHEFEMEGRRMDFTHLAEDNFEHGDYLMTDRGAEGRDTDIGLTVEGREDDLHYKLEVPLESATQEMQEDGSSEPQVESHLVMEGEL